jgi:hypothetical protein
VILGMKGVAVGGRPGMAVPSTQYQVSPSATGVTGKHKGGEVGVRMAGERVPAAIKEWLPSPKLTTGRKIVLVPGSVAPATNSRHSIEITIFVVFIIVSTYIVETGAGSRCKFGIKKRAQTA